MITYNCVFVSSCYLLLYFVYYILACSAGYLSEHFVIIVSLCSVVHLCFTLAVMRKKRFN